MGYFNTQNLRRFVGKTIKKVESAHEGTVTFIFTDKTTMTIDACVEHETIQRQINLIVNTDPVRPESPPRDVRPITVVRQPEEFAVPPLTFKKHLDRFRVVAGGIVLGEVQAVRAPVSGWQYCYRGTWYRQSDDIAPTRGKCGALLFQTWAQDNGDLARSMTAKHPQARGRRMVGLAGNTGL